MGHSCQTPAERFGAFFGAQSLHFGQVPKLPEQAPQIANQSQQPKSVSAFMLCDLQQDSRSSVLPLGCRMKSRAQSSNHLLGPTAPGVWSPPCQPVPQPWHMKGKQLPSYLHVGSWKAPQGIEAQAGVLYYNRSLNLQ